MTDKKRIVDKGEHRFSISIPINEDPTPIKCPQCSQKAFVVLADEKPELGYAVKAVCPNCGFSSQKVTTERKFFWQEDEPSDGFFDYQLWMRVDCCGESLWAFNLRHLEFLEEFVQAELRERPKDGLGHANGSLSSRLPKWIQSGKHRDKLLRCLEKLRALGGYERDFK